MTNGAVEQFVASARANGCHVSGPLAPDDASERIVETVMRHAGTGEVAIPLGDPILDTLGVPGRIASTGTAVLSPDAPDWDRRLADATVGITGCRGAVAATGTVAVVTGRGSPRATSLLPPVHIAVVRAHDVVADFSSAITQFAEGELPSALLWISGPSRTSDLEMKPTIGVHGPKVVELVIVDDEQDESDAKRTGSARRVG